MHLKDWILGKALRTSEAEEAKITAWAGVSLLGLDGLSSAAYGPEAAMTVLLPVGAMGVAALLPVMGVIVGILGILYFSYRQTIRAYPNGGGSYTVAKANLGKNAGLFAAAALILDYTLNAAVGISAGVGALVSAVPPLHHVILPLCLFILGLLTIVNLRGVKEAGAVFFAPTYLFIGTLFAVIVYGFIRAVGAGGHPVPIVAPPKMPVATEALGLWLLIKAFASGCTAMTGVEAVSNGVQNFEKPRVERAQLTLTVIVVTLAVLLLGVSALCRIYHVAATDPVSNKYQSVISQLVSAVIGRNWAYYITLGCTILVLALSANTSFAGFPRLCHLIAEDDFLPRMFTIRGRRLVYTAGILILCFFAGTLLVAFGGITDRLIPLFAVGAFLAFTLSQAGMVVHWLKNREKGWKLSMVVNGLGAVATAAALAVVLVAKFVHGAWITAILIPCAVLFFRRVERHYQRVREQIACPKPIDVSDSPKPIAIVPLKEWTYVTQKALRFAITMTDEVIVVHVDADEDEEDKLEPDWTNFVVKPLEAAGKTAPQLKRVQSPYRRFIKPILEQVDETVKANPGRAIIVVVPQLVESRWFEWPLHNQRSNLLKAALLFHGGPDVVVANVPWYLQDSEFNA